MSANIQGRACYQRLTPKMALLLAAPHSWAASVIPVLSGAAFAVFRGFIPQLSLLLSLAAVCILMQSAVNTFNDYADYIKGTDTLENSPDANDAVLVYNNPNPRSVLLLGFAYLVSALIFAIPALMRAFAWSLIIGLIGAVTVLTYSFGKKPLSYLPLGELVSGFVMGGLIPLAVYGVLTLEQSFLPLLYALPSVCGIALIMYTNNGCDIERDTGVGRKTFAVLMGRERAEKIYRTALVVWIVMPLILLPISRSALYILLAVLAMPSLLRQLRTPLDPKFRGMLMGGISGLNIMLGLSYALAMSFNIGV